MTRNDLQRLAKNIREVHGFDIADERDRAVCFAADALERHIHATALGPTGPPRFDEVGAHDHGMPDKPEDVSDPFRRLKQLWIALGQVARAQHLEGSTPRVVDTLALVVRAYGDHLDSRHLVSSGTGPTPGSEEHVAGLLATAKHFCGVKETE